MMRGTTLLVLLLSTCQPALSDEAPRRWECICTTPACVCTPLPEVNSQLCDIICPLHTKYTRDCTCETMTREESERAQKEILERQERASSASGK